MSTQNFTYDSDNLNDYQLHVTVGSPASPDGQTIVDLNGSGTIEAKQLYQLKDQKEKQPSIVEGRIDNPEEYFKPLEQFDWQRTFPSRPGIPDEAIINWMIETKGEKKASLRMWLGEAEDDERYNNVLKKIRSTIGRLSDNQIYL